MDDGTKGSEGGYMARSNSLLTHLNFRTATDDDLITEVDHAFEETRIVLVDDPNPDLHSRFLLARQAFMTWKDGLARSTGAADLLPHALAARDDATQALGRIIEAASHICAPEADRDTRTTDENVAIIAKSVLGLVRLFRHARPERFHNADYTSQGAAPGQAYSMSSTLDETNSDPVLPSARRTTKPLSPSNTNVAAGPVPGSKSRTESQRIHNFQRATSDGTAKVQNGNIINDLKTYLEFSAAAEQGLVQGHNYVHLHAGGNSIMHNGDYYGPGSPFSSSPPTSNGEDENQRQNTGPKRRGTWLSKIKSWSNQPQALD